MIKFSYDRNFSLEGKPTANQRLIAASQIRKGYKYHTFLPSIFPHMGLITYGEEGVRFYKFCFRRFTFTYTREE